MTFVPADTINMTDKTQTQQSEMIDSIVLSTKHISGAPDHQINVTRFLSSPAFYLDKVALYRSAYRLVSNDGKYEYKFTTFANQDIQDKAKKVSMSALNGYRYEVYKLFELNIPLAITKYKRVFGYLTRVPKT